MQKTQIPSLRLFVYVLYIIGLNFKYNSCPQCLDKKESQISPKQASLEDFARTRETSRNVESLDERDLNAAEEMLLASLEAIRKEREFRAAQRDSVTKSA